MTRRTSLAVPAAAFLLALLLAGCGGGTTPGGGGGSATLAIASGSGQQGTVAQALTQPLVVKASTTSGAAAGLTVNFAVATGGGTLSAATATTDANGNAQVTWTLGTKAGATTNTATAVLKGGTTASTLTFTAIAKAGAATAAKIDTATNNQRGVAGQPLARPVSALITDQFGNGVSNASVTWSVTSGAGSVLPVTSVSDSTGRASTTWTLGPGNGTQTLSAAVAGLSAASLAVSATAIDIAITAIAPDTLSEGVVATITGRGFSTDPAQNIITVGGVAVNATTASTNSITFTVPAGACAPAGPAAVTLSSGGAIPPSVAKVFRPGQFVSLPVGQQMIVTDPTKFCLQFAPTTATESYLVGVLNPVDNGSNLVSSLITLSTGSAGASGLVAAARASSVSATPSFLSSLISATTSADAGDWSNASRRIRLHREAMFEFRRKEIASTVGLRLRPSASYTVAPSSGVASGSAAGKASVSLGVSASNIVGDTVKVKVINLNSTDNLCLVSSASVVTATVKAVGTKGIWVEDVTDANSYTDADYTALSNELDTQIYTKDVTTWGNPSDLDNNGRIVVVISNVVNRGNPNVLGFVFSGDLFPTTAGTGCPSSNVGEYYYGKAPGVYGSDSYPRASAIVDAPFIIAHEFTHIIQNGVEKVNNLGDLKVWEREGQATLSEALNGFVAEGRSLRQDYGIDVAFEQFDTTRTAWYEDRFVDLADFYGFNGVDANKNDLPKIAGAPEQCTLVQPTLSSTLGPCIGGRQAYGNSSMLLQYALDRFGPTYPGGENQLTQNLVSSGDSGLINLSRRVKLPVDSLLAQYYASLYVDGRITGADPTLQISTWNLFSIFEGTCCTGRKLRTSARLIPDSTAFVPFSVGATVRGGSNKYVRVVGAGRPAAALRVRGPDDASFLPTTTRLWVVRLQ